MKKIHKFVLKSYLGPMVLTFLIVMFVLMMNFVWLYIDELVGKGIDGAVIVELILYSLATMIPMGLPLATLFAAIMTMGNLGENYELLAMKSAGMSLMQILKPLFIVVFFVAVGSFFAANNLVPYSNKKMFSLLYDIRQQKQSIEFQDGVFFNGVDNLSIRVGTQDPETHLLRDVLIYDNRNTSGNMTTMVADSGYIRLSDDKKYLLIMANRMSRLATIVGTTRTICVARSSPSRMVQVPLRDSILRAQVPICSRRVRPRTSTNWIIRSIRSNTSLP